jgi:outer membrane receptor protein involved in Fe transport
LSALRTGLLACLAWGGLHVTPAYAAEPTARLSADIAPQPVSEALETFGRQTGLQVIYVSSAAEAQHSKGARAGLTASAALYQLLEGTGLTFEFLNARTVKIFPKSAVVSAPTVPSSSASHAQRYGSSRAPVLDEIVITGSRGSVPLSRAPMDIKLWTEEAMEASGIEGMAQLGALTPGVGFAFSPGVGSDIYTHLDIRGVTNKWGATVGPFLGDTPIPPARAATYLASFPLTFDLDHVEILAGPQTVLLGDHTQAGAIRFIPNQPSLTTSTGLFRAQWGTTEYGGPSYEAGAAVGGPIVKEVLGFRLTGWYREEGGYVDRVDPVTGVALDVNANRAFSELFRGALTFTPSANVQVTPSLTYQSIRLRDTSTFDSTLSDPSHGLFKNPSPVQQPAEDTYYLASVKLAARLSTVDLNAVASYFYQTANAVIYLQEPADYYTLEQRACSADARLSSHDPDATLTWVAGLFSSDEHTHNPHFAPPGIYADTAFMEQSRLEAFGQVGRMITPGVTATVGVRVGYVTHHYSDDAPPLQGETSDTWYAPRLGLSWQVDEANLVYLTIAKGYGSPTFYPLSDTPTPADALWNYEIGSKHDLLNGRLQLETSVFHIEWDNGSVSPDLLLGTERLTLPGKAVSNGFGLTTQAWVTQLTKVAVDIAYTDAHVTHTIRTPGGELFARAGDSLLVSPWKVTASIEQELRLASGSTASLRVEDAFRSAPGATYVNDPASGYYLGHVFDPSVNVLNIRIAARSAHFEVAAFLRNALNVHPSLYGIANGADNLGTTTQVFTLVPRTLSVSGTWRY